MASPIPETRIDELMQRIRAEIRQNRDGCGQQAVHPSSGPSGLPGLSLQLPRLGENIPEPGHDGVLRLNEMLGYHDQTFIAMVYRLILKRPADGTGSRHYLEGLRRGRFSKAEIIGRLRFSSEGRARGVRVKGLLPALAVGLAGKIPVLGYLVQGMAALVRLPILVRHLERLENQMSQRDRSLRRQADQWADLLEAAAADTLSRHGFDALWTDTGTRLSDQEQGLARLSEDLAKHAAQAHARLSEDLERRLSGKSDQAAFIDLRRMVLDQQRRLALLLEEARKRLPEPMGAEQIRTLAAETDHLLDALYVSFEDRFRGTREDIKSRQRVYLSHIEQAGAGTDEAPILDLGCGRGEWLELLGENRKTAMGVDLNRILVSESLTLGLSVVEQDALSYMKSLTSNTLGAITAFHLIEHLPLNTLVAILDESLRVLRPGGLLIVETPNPENLRVGACRFYIDPTHQNPLPPVTTQYLMEARGFVGCDCLRLHPCDLSAEPDDMAAALPDSLVRMLCGEQDYAVLARKPGRGNDPGA